LKAINRNDRAKGEETEWKRAGEKLRSRYWATSLFGAKIKAVEYLERKMATEHE